MRQNNFIPQGGVNPMQMMQQFQQFKKDFYAQNGPNADAKSAVMNILNQNGMDSQAFISQGTNLYNGMMNQK